MDLATLVMVATAWAAIWYLAGILTGRYLIPPLYDLVCRLRRGPSA